jgi:Domain of unknown function (DUF4145)
VSESVVEVGQTLKAQCSNCEGERTCEIKGCFSQTVDEADIIFWTSKYILQCRGCENTFFMQTSANSEELDYVYLSNSEHETVAFEKKEYWPALLKRQVPEWFGLMRRSKDYDEDKLECPLSELYKALNNDLPILTAIAVRTCFDVVSEVCKVDESLTFEKKLDQLESLGRISITQKSRLTILVDAGGASAHRGWVPTLDDVNSLVDLLEDFLQNVFAIPDLQRSLNEKARKLHAKVPARKKRIKSPKKK